MQVVNLQVYSLISINTVQVLRTVNLHVQFYLLYSNVVLLVVQRNINRFFIINSNLKEK